MTDALVRFTTRSGPLYQVASEDEEPTHYAISASTVKIMQRMFDDNRDFIPPQLQNLLTILSHEGIINTKNR